MDTKQAQSKQPAPRKPGSTSPPDGRTDKATKPPGTGVANREAIEKGWAALDLAAGAH
jgi:hypothetical protein